jgi:hypothetical protein
MWKTMLIPILVFASGCGATMVSFVPSGSDVYPPKPAGHDVQVFFEGDRPAREFQVLGMVYAEKEANTTTRWDIIKPDEVIRLLKLEAAKHGADAIIDVRISSAEHRARDWKRGEAKAIVFK